MKLSINFGKLFQCQYYKNLFWLKIFGKGFSVKDINKNPLLFSERNAITNGLLIKNYYFKIL